MTYQRLTRLISGIAIAVMAFLSYESFSLRGGKVYAMCVCFACLFFAIIVFVNSFIEQKKSGKTIDEAKAEYKPMFNGNIIFIMIMPFIMAFLWTKITFMGGTAICLFVIFLYLKQKWLVSLISTLAITVAMQLIFVNIFSLNFDSPSWWIYW